MKYITLSILALLSSQTFGQSEGLLKSPEKCGEYKVSGVVRFDKDLKILVHEKALSQITISFINHEAMPLASYVDSHIYANVVLTDKLTGVTQITAKSIEGKIALRSPDPMKSDNTGFSLVKELPCEKKL